MNRRNQIQGLLINRNSLYNHPHQAHHHQLQQQQQQQQSSTRTDTIFEQEYGFFEPFHLQFSNQQIPRALNDDCDVYKRHFDSLLNLNRTTNNPFIYNNEHLMTTTNDLSSPSSMTNNYCWQIQQQEFEQQQETVATAAAGNNHHCYNDNNDLKIPNSLSDDNNTNCSDNSMQLYEKIIENRWSPQRSFSNEVTAASATTVAAADDAPPAPAAWVNFSNL